MFVPSKMRRLAAWAYPITVATVLGAMSSLTGCVHYRAKPISPVANLSAIEARSVDDPELKRFLETNHVTISDPPRWDLRALTLVAFYFRPELDEARAASEGARATQQIALERPNPQLQPTIGYNTTTPPPWFPGLGLAIPIETAGKRGVRLAVAQHLYQAAQQRIVSTAWQVRVRVRRSMLDFVAAGRIEEILKRQSALQDQIVQLMERQLAAGAITPFELTQARLAAANAKLAADQAGLQRASSGTALANAIGMTPPMFARMAPFVVVDDITKTEIPDEAARRQALVSRSDILAALADYEAAQGALQLEIRRQYPDIVLGPGYLLDQTDNKWSIAPTVTLPVLNRNRGEIARAQALREEAAAHVVTVQSEALLEVSQAAATLAAARQKLATAESLLATARQDEQRTLGRFKFGDVSRQEVLNAQLVSVAAEVARYDALLQAEAAAGALEDSMQSPVDIGGVVMTNPRR